VRPGARRDATLQLEQRRAHLLEVKPPQAIQLITHPPSLAEARRQHQLHPGLHRTSPRLQVGTLETPSPGPVIPAASEQRRRFPGRFQPTCLTVLTA
jgi:hypothetical protein